jgi:hypothetical protein
MCIGLNACHLAILVRAQLFPFDSLNFQMMFIKYTLLVVLSIQEQSELFIDK